MQPEHQHTIKNSAERCECDACGVWLEVGNTVVVMPDHSIYCIACAEALEVKAMPKKDEPQDAKHSPRVEPPAPDPATHGLFGFQPTPATGRQRHLFGDDTPASTDSATWPQSRHASTVSKTWPRPWAKSTPADMRIARQYKPDATPANLF